MQIRQVRQALETVLKDAGKPVPARYRETVALKIVKIADERNVFDPDELSALVRAELGMAASPSDPKRPSP